MVLILGNLPDNTEEKDIRELFSHSTTLTDVSFFEKSNTCCHSDYECTLTLNSIGPIAGYAMQNKLHGYCWKGRCIHAHVIIF